jgi:hypothetical protein
VACLQATANASTTNILTKAMMEEVVTDHLEQQRIKDSWAGIALR